MIGRGSELDDESPASVPDSTALRWVSDCHMSVTSDVVRYVDPLACGWRGSRGAAREWRWIR